MFQSDYLLSILRASQTLPAPRYTPFYRSRKVGQALRQWIKEIAVTLIRSGYKRINPSWLREDWRVNYK